MPRSRSTILNQVLPVAQMRAAEEDLIAAGTDVDALMQRAGRGAGEWVRRMAGGGSVTVLCGPGNNGGDGWVIAEYLREHGNSVRVVAGREPSTAAARNARALFSGGIVGADADVSGDVLVDCLFGSGLTRALPDDLFALLCRLAVRHRQRVAIDVPSGIESDSGLALNEGLPQWGLTVALGAWKPAHFAMPACAGMGALRLVDIGVGKVPGSARVLERPVIARPKADAHKYRRGMVGLIGGEMPGATLLAAQAALRAGAGYVKLAAEKPPAGVPPELVAGNDVAVLLDDDRMAALLVGPGLGRSDAASRTLAQALAANTPVVVDADALVLLRPAMVAARICEACAVLTPHDGEMAVLESNFGLAGAGLRHERAQALAVATGAVVVLKGPDSVIAAPSGEVVMAPRASSWLSVAGTGDVLAGIIASRLAVHAQPLRAAEEGLWLHGEAARLAGDAFTAGELAHAVQTALREAME